MYFVYVHSCEAYTAEHYHSRAHPFHVRQHKHTQTRTPTSIHAVWYWWLSSRVCLCAVCMRACVCATSMNNGIYAIRLGMKLYEVVAWIVHTKLVKKRAPLVRQVEITVAIFVCATCCIFVQRTKAYTVCFFFFTSHRCWFFTTFHFTYRSFVVSEIQLARSNTHFLCFKYRFVQW